jgi:hypothetical protein
MVLGNNLKKGTIRLIMSPNEISVEEVHARMDKIVAEILNGRIKTSKQLDKRLYSLGLKRVPLDSWEEVCKNEIKDTEARIENLKSRKESLYFFIFGLAIGFVGSLLAGGSLHPVFVAIIAGAFIVTIYFFLKLNSKIKGANLLLKEWYPYIIIRTTATAVDY